MFDMLGTICIHFFLYRIYSYSLSTSLIITNIHQLKLKLLYNMYPISDYLSVLYKY